MGFEAPEYRQSKYLGYKCMAIHVLVHTLISLCYKSRMFSVPIDSLCNVFCDNEMVTKSLTRAESTLKKKHISISYHQAQEAVDGGILIVFYEKTKSNYVDLFTKTIK